MLGFFYFIVLVFYTYILQSEKTSKLYIGQTNNIEERLKRHNNGENKSTKSGVPWRLVYSISFATRSEAVVLERKLKNWKNPQKVLTWIEQQSG